MASSTWCQARSSLRAAAAASTPKFRVHKTRVCIARAEQEPTTVVTTVEPPATQAAAPVPSTSTNFSANSANSGNGIAAGAALAAVAAFAVGRLFSGGPSLAALEELATPLDVALSNGKPTVVEFYANWCKVCNELVPDEIAIEKQYGSSVNLVMLNIENTKWAEEAAEYRVGGIPHFVFIDKEGKPLAAAVGRLPRSVLEGNVAALADGKPLPFAGARGPTSSMTPPDGAAATRQAAPRDHA
eukprot:CAMPEP_0202869286 /NCGR_PEP_ID=MMETSP1391-20130828/12357_1 /ASSEMBLY_ACC=CAM_ASM_000867 /TAXON_ID=1034604 /ORGANISM="Chlamydomonas leiostraca, Strain SAG 11-49" /LENGTH=242 /DNA_ID=CAMNT_0049549593 /DNA_START=31 /DNA_END=759 /DNA_ORIENTATION=+